MFREDDKSIRNTARATAGVGKVSADEDCLKSGTEFKRENKKRNQDKAKVLRTR
jgi:hypothetical protein